MPDPIAERPSFLKRRAWRLNASTLGGDQPPEEKERLLQEAKQLLNERLRMQKDLDRAVNHPATHHTATASGAQEGEPPCLFPRALRRTLLDLGLSVRDADHFVRVEKNDEEQDQKPSARAARRRM